MEIAEWNFQINLNCRSKWRLFNVLPLLLHSQMGMELKRAFPVICGIFSRRIARLQTNPFRTNLCQAQPSANRENVYHETTKASYTCHETDSDPTPYSCGSGSCLQATEVTSCLGFTPWSQLWRSNAVLNAGWLLWMSHPIWKCNGDVPRRVQPLIEVVQCSVL